MIIEGVPDSITRADYLRLVASVGFEPKMLRSLEFRVDGVYAVIAEHYAVNREGHKFISAAPDGEDEVAVHRVYIPVVD